VEEIRVLVVDDEERFARNLVRILSLRGFAALPAFSGFEAIEAIEHGSGFDVVVLDVKMEGMDGIATLGEIRKRAPDIEVIMLTGHATLDSGIRAIREGAFDYLMKPCEIETLIDKIREAFEVERIRRYPVLWPRTMVKEVMLFEPKILKQDELLARALEDLSRESGESVEEIYIVDAGERLLGILAKRDLLAEAEAASHTPVTWSELTGHPTLLPRKPVSSVMRTGFQSTHPDEPLSDVAAHMIEGRIHLLPVVSEGKMTGLVRIQDVLRHIRPDIAG
jgi:CheY-like chemotaxis protein